MVSEKICCKTKNNVNYLGAREFFIRVSQYISITICIKIHTEQDNRVYLLGGGGIDPSAGKETGLPILWPT